MLDATLRERARGLLTASGPQQCSAVHGDGCDGGRRRASKRPAAMSFTWKWDQPAASAPKTAISAAHAALDAGRIDYTSALGMPSLRERIARHYRETYGCAVDAERIVVTTGSSGAFILGFLAMFEPGDRVAGDGPRLSAVSPYPHRARLRAGADRDVERNPSCADRRKPCSPLIAERR